VQSYATGLGRALGMSETEIQGVQTAALLHDIGKLAVPEHILAKPGPLSPEEFQKVRIHPQVGAEIIAAVPFPYPVAPLILSHHERWDGRGYPAGLKEDAIPLGARVLCTVDYFDALTSDRPYHKAITTDAAIALLQQESGKALDPRVVDAFVRILPDLQRADERMESNAARIASAWRTDDRSASAGGVAKGTVPSVFDDIAVAHREIYALYQIAQSMGTSLGVADTMALISSKLMDLVPFSACGLFLYCDTTDSLQCRFATGTDSELIQQLSLRSGQGLTGWVARNRRPLVNARPSADLEAMGSKAPTVLESALVCPLISGERLIGTLAVYHTGSSFYGEDHRRLLDRVCEQAAAVIHNAVVFEQTQEDSLTDPLTGLPNTRSMFQHLTRELARAERLKAEVSLLVMDLDHFKEINDTCGHHMGDRALREVAAVLRNAIRPYDMCVRYAGDEFIVVLSGCGGEEAEHKRLELKAAVDHLTFETAPGHRWPLAISAGTAVFPHDGDSYESLLAKADSRMYRDKSARKTDPARQLRAGASFDSSAFRNAAAH
jgi:diguanylate cyclase (GGDEF)-like protein